MSVCFGSTLETPPAQPHHFAMHFTLYAALIAGLVYVGIVAWLRVKKGSGVVHLLFFTVFYVYLFKVLDYTLFQYQSLILMKYFHPHLQLRGDTAANSVNLLPLVGLRPADVRTSLLNILFFVPFGFGLPFITSLRMMHVVLAGALFSISIEVLQLLTGFVGGITFRVADVNDVIFNTLGAGLGYAVFLGFLRTIRHPSLNARRSGNPIGRYILARPQGG